MHSIKSIAAGLIMGIATVAMTTSPAHAVLIEQDLNVAGDMLVTVDSVTGFEWLDLNATLGQSYNAAEASFFVTNQGFRHATGAEVTALFVNGGATVGANIVANFAPSLEFLAKLGCNGNCGGTNNPFGQGWFDDGSAVGLGLYVALLNVSPTTGLFLLNTPVFCGIPACTKDSIVAETGNFLVRAGTAIPEPPALALMFAGLAALAGFRRRRKNG